ncbi:MAG: hypothetical protein K8R64_07160 [Methanosarcinaceae archaeon]|nr:hypothetical protein [Methanosarcinaceae archaeon]
MDTITHNYTTTDFKKINAFLYDIRYIIIFYVFGDFITTFHALNYGFEENGFLAAVMADYGIWSLLVLKFLFLGIVYWNYKTLRDASKPWTTTVWNASKFLVAFAGFVLVVNNLMVIFSRCSLFEFIGIL